MYTCSHFSYPALLIPEVFVRMLNCSEMFGSYDEYSAKLARKQLAPDDLLMWLKASSESGYVAGKQNSGPDLGLSERRPEKRCGQSKGHIPGPGSNPGDLSRAGR